MLFDFWTTQGRGICEDVLPRVGKKSVAFAGEQHVYR